MLVYHVRRIGPRGRSWFGSDAVGAAWQRRRSRARRAEALRTGGSSPLRRLCLRHGREIRVRRFEHRGPAQRLWDGRRSLPVRPFGHDL